MTPGAALGHFPAPPDVLFLQATAPRRLAADYGTGRVAVAAVDEAA